MVALGHHTDDLTQITLLNLLYHGKVETMASRRTYFDGALRLVRQLCYTTEKALGFFVRASDFHTRRPTARKATTRGES